MYKLGYKNKKNRRESREGSFMSLLLLLEEKAQTTSSKYLQN